PEPGIVTPQPGLPALQREHTYYLMTVGDDATPSCQAWNVEPDVGDPDLPTTGKLVNGSDEVPYHSRGDELFVCGQVAAALLDAATDECQTYRYDIGRLGVWSERTASKKPAMQDTGQFSTGPSEYSFAFYASFARDGATSYYLYRNTCEASFALAKKRAAWLP